ncbi:UNVERIFIED_CONTAM: hypothetical protein K2H54_046857 [Gekko kuhli]
MMGILPTVIRRHLNLWYCPVQIALPELPPFRVILRENQLIKNTEMHTYKVGPPVLSTETKAKVHNGQPHVYLSVIQTAAGGGGDPTLRQCKEKPLHARR